MSRLLLKISNEGDSTTSLGNLCQCSVTLSITKNASLGSDGTSCVSVGSHCLLKVSPQSQLILSKVSSKRLNHLLISEFETCHQVKIVYIQNNSIYNSCLCSSMLSQIPYICSTAKPLRNIPVN